MDFVQDNLSRSRRGVVRGLHFQYPDAQGKLVYVLEGELTFSVGGQTHPGSRGDFVHIPRGTVHAFKNGPTPARLLATFSPAGIEGFFRAVGELATEGSTPLPVTAETIARLLAAEIGGWQDHHETLPPPSE